MLRSHQIALLEEKKDEGAGGGGAAKPFTDEQQTAIGQIVNSAVTSHLKRSLGPAIADGLKGVNWVETLKLDDLVVGKLKEVAATEPDAEEKAKGKGGTKGLDDAVQRQLQELATKLENSEKGRAEEVRLRQEAETQRSMDRATGELRNLLQPKVRGELLDLLVRDLATNQKRLKVGDGGAVTLTVKRAPYKGAPEQEEDVALGEAVPLWIASEDAKVFLPAPGAASATPQMRGLKVPQVNPGSGGQLPTDPAARTFQQLEALGMDPVASLLD